MARDSTASRDQLLAATAALMIETGSVDVPLSDIAARAQLNSALVKYYFGGKSGLLTALAQDVLSRALGQLQELVQMDLDPVEKIKLHIKGVITTYYRFPFINRLLHALFMQPDTAAEVARTISAPLAEVQRQLLAEAEAAGLIRPIDPIMFYFIVLARVITCSSARTSSNTPSISTASMTAFAAATQTPCSIWSCAAC